MLGAFDIREHIWNIYEISKQQQYLNMREAFNMFIVNVELGFDRYKGADVDYAKLKEKWELLSILGKRRQLAIFDYILKHFSVFILHCGMNSNREMVEKFRFIDIPGLEKDNYKYYNISKTQYDKITKKSGR